MLLTKFLLFLTFFIVSYGKGEITRYPENFYIPKNLKKMHVDNKNNIYRHHTFTALKCKGPQYLDALGCAFR